MRHMKRTLIFTGERHTFFVKRIAYFENSTIQYDKAIRIVLKQLSISI